MSEMEKTYNKLVRNRIPEIIESRGGSCEWRVLDKDEYMEALKAKLVEEAQELLGTDDAEGFVWELSDVMEVIDCLLEATEVSMLAVREVQRRKREKRGGFENHLFLISSEDSHSCRYAEVDSSEEPLDPKQVGR